MHCLAGLDTATHGSVTVGEYEITGLDDRALTTCGGTGSGSSSSRSTCCRR